MPTAEIPVDIFRIQLVAIIGSVAMIVFIIELIRRKKLKEKYALLWLAAGLAMIVFSVWRGFLDRVAYALGVAYAPALLFLVALAFGAILMIHFSVIISDLSEKNKTLAQEIALLKEDLRSLKTKSGS